MIYTHIQPDYRNVSSPFVECVRTSSDIAALVSPIGPANVPFRVRSGDV
jgi:hypothetical protein